MFILKENTLGKTAKYETTLDIDINGDVLTFSLVAKDSKLFSYSDQYNGDLYNGDVIEVFLTEGDLEHYYEIEVAPNGAMFFAIIDNIKGKRKINYLPKDGVSSIVTVEDNNYIVKLVVDLSKLHITNKKDIVYNVFRIETNGGKETYLMALNPTLGPTFHDPKKFISLL